MWFYEGLLKISDASSNLSEGLLVISASGYIFNDHIVNEIDKMYEKLCKNENKCIKVILHMHSGSSSNNKLK